MKKILLYLLLALFAGQTEATRPLRRVFTKVQSDGTTLSVINLSNHRFSLYTTPDGISLKRNEKGDFCYAVADRQELAASEYIAHEAGKRTPAEQHFATTAGLKGEKAIALLQTNSLQPAYTETTRSVSDGLGVYGQSGKGVVSSIGTPVIPVVMVEFPDKKFAAGTTAEKLSRALNEPGYADEALCVGSVKDYFTAQSNGLFVPSFEVVATIVADKGYAYYGKNSGSKIDVYCNTLIQEALQKAVAQGVDFSRFKDKTSGAVPLVSIYYAGPGEHSAYETGAEDYLWAHFSRTSFTAGNVKISSYFVGNELLQSYDNDIRDAQGELIPTGASFDGIGVFVHEFGHALGLPDFYYTGNDATIANTLQTLNFWSIMDYGQYYCDGYAPVGYNALERSMMGWLDVHELTEAQSATLYPFGSEDKGNTAYCIRNDSNPKEYFLLENRQRGTWYPASMGHGMLITHIDYDATAWNNNTLNNTPAHQRFQIVPADNEKFATSWGSYQGDLFPGTGNVRSFTDDTTPASTVYTGGRLGKPLYGITESDGIVHFVYLDETLTAITPALSSAADATLTEVFTPEGRKVATLSSAADTARLKPGMYLLKSGNQCRKVFVR